MTTSDNLTPLAIAKLPLSKTARMSDVKAAAEKLRPHCDHEHFPWMPRVAERAAMWTLARAYLAEHPECNEDSADIAERAKYVNALDAEAK